MGSWWDRGHFMKKFRFNTICNITQEPQELQWYNRACRFILYPSLRRGGGNYGQFSFGKTFFSYLVLWIVTILNYFCFLFGENRTFRSKVTNEWSELDHRRETYFLCFLLFFKQLYFLSILLFFKQRYLRNYQK